VPQRPAFRTRNDAAGHRSSLRCRSSATDTDGSATRRELGAVEQVGSESGRGRTGAVVVDDGVRARTLEIHIGVPAGPTSTRDVSAGGRPEQSGLTGRDIPAAAGTAPDFGAYGSQT
jgi:hypothetical protein